jgi:hypothetical protein
MKIIWQDAWDVLSQGFGQLAASVAAEHPGMTWSCGHGDNESFPFRAYASFSGRGRRDEDVVVSVDFLLKDVALHYSSDVARGDGELLSEGPSGAFKFSPGTDQLRSEIRSAVSRTTDFCVASESVVSAELRWAISEGMQGDPGDLQGNDGTG